MIAILQQIEQRIRVYWTMYLSTGHNYYFFKTRQAKEEKTIFQKEYIGLSDIYPELFSNPLNRRVI